MKLKLFILFLLISSSLFAQKVTTSIDSTKKKIGAEFKLTLKTETDSASKVKFPEAKLFGALEVIQSYKIDTIKNGNRYELIKKYGLTQFDSGKYAIPRLPVLINGKPVFSDSLKVEVADVKVDTLKQKMYDIKTITQVKTKSNWWKYLLALLILAAIVYLGYKFYKKLPKKEKQEVQSFKTPIEKATTLLQQLETKELWQKGEIKSYYSELTDIARTYIEEEMNIPAMESTTSELIFNLKNTAKQKKLKLSPETVSNLEKVLKQADLVKFAKVKPVDFEIEEDKKRIANSIVTIHKSIPIIVEEDNELAIWNEQQREKARLEKLKKQKRNKIIKIASVFVGICTFLVVYLSITKGFDYLKDNILGHPTKDLIEGEWVFSEYGNPGVKIETPKVLKRLDATKSIPKEALKALKDFNIFAYGSMINDFYITVSTANYKQQMEIDLDKAIEGSLKALEGKGATNMIVKTEEYDTQQGISGKKAYGTTTIVDMVSQKSAKMHYEMLVFSQSGGLQQILIMYKDGDQYGEQIADRILNSVELKQAQ